MVKKFAPPRRASQIRSSVRLPVGMKSAMEEAMVAQAWSLKRRSAWIASACEALLANEDREELIREEFYDGKTIVLPLALDSDLVLQMDQLAESMTGPQRIVDRSSVIRTAITQAVMAAAGRQLVRGVPPGDTSRKLTHNELG